MERKMYQVIEMYGDSEPWWFLEDWEKDIVSSRHFVDYYEALKYYKQEWLVLRGQSPLFKSRSDLMTIFWDPQDRRWCEECVEYVQQYHSIALLENDEKIPNSKLRPGYEKGNGHKIHRSCKIGFDTKKIETRNP